MADLYISIGSNIEPEKNVRAAVTHLRQDFGQVRCSSVYRSKAVGFDGDDFLNLVVAAQTKGPVDQVVATLHRIEDQLGRDRCAPRFSSRTLDLDLLMYDALVLRSHQLHLPREEILQQAFVLQPLAELAPDLIHPLTKQTMAMLWQSFDRELQVLIKTDITLPCS